MRTAAISAGVCLFMTNLACFAQTSSTVTARVETRIPPQALESALKQFGKLDHMHVVYLTADVNSKRTHGAYGNLTVGEALSRLLSGTGLAYRVTDGGAISIFSASGSAREAPSSSGAAGIINRSKPTSPKPLEHPSADKDPRAASHYIHKHSGDNYRPYPLEEVTVTAQKYRQRAFDVPISLEVISGNELLTRGITDLSNLQYDVPGLYVNGSGYTHSVYIRGVANDSGNGAVVGQYIDEADITAEGTSGQAGLATGDVGLYDLNRVEVLKGPQGTLYGDGSMGGVIRYITNKPALNRFQMSANVAAMLTQYGAPSQRIEAMLNTPVISGVFGLRFAGLFEHDGGWVDEPAANLKNTNDSNRTDVRAEALWQPAIGLKINATQILHRHASGLGMGEDTRGDITPIFGATLVPNQADNANISNVTVTYDAAAVSLLSSSSYLSETQDIRNLMVTTPLGSITIWTMYPQYHSHDKDYSEEVRLARSGRGPWQWTIGGFYKHFHDQIEFSDFSGLAGSTLSSAFFSPESPFGNASTSGAAFANTSYILFGRVTVGAGMRYYRDREASIPQSRAATFTSTDPRFYMQYRVTPYVNVYASASKGFRSGGFNAPSEPTYGPESVWSYDLGTKIRLPKPSLSSDIDLFYMNYSDYVNLTYIPPLYESANIGEGRIKGVDATFTWKPDEAWEFRLNAEILKTEFLTASAISGYAAGDRLPFAPKYSFTASVTRAFHISDMPGEVEIYYYELSRVQDRTLGLPLEESDIQRNLDFRAALHLSAELQFGAFARNVLNSRGNASPWALFNESIRPRPRTIGLDFQVRF